MVLAHRRSKFRPRAGRGGNTRRKSSPAAPGVLRSRESHILLRASTRAEFRASQRRSWRDCEIRRRRSTDQSFRRQRAIAARQLPPSATQFPALSRWRVAALHARSLHQKLRHLFVPGGPMRKPCPPCHNTGLTPARPDVGAHLRKLAPYVATTIDPRSLTTGG